MTEVDKLNPTNILFVLNHSYPLLSDIIDGVTRFNNLGPKNLFRNILHEIVHLWLFILKIYGDLEWLVFEAIVL